MVKAIGFTFIFLLLPSAYADDEKLSEKALFQRCYMHLTQQYADKNNAYLKKIVAGEMSAIEACSTILDLATITDGTNFKNQDDISLNVVSVFQNLHYSWFSQKEYVEIQDYYIRNFKNLYSPSNPALYFTKAFFDTNYTFKEIFSGDLTLRAKRETASQAESPFQTGNPYTHAATEDILQGVKYAGYGKLLGIESESKNLTYTTIYANTPGSTTDTSTTETTSIVNTHFGGGVMGSQPYMILNIQGNTLNSYRPNGGVLSNRVYSRNLISDFLCRSLPAVRSADVGEYVDTESDLTYRNSKGCVKCHATIDPLGALVRNTDYTRKAKFNDRGGAYAFLYKHEVEKPSASYFPTAADSDFYRRPTEGHFLYRTYDGQLVYKEMSSLNGLGAVIAELDDPYVCAAKRYFQYFTGIDANISDIADPDNVDFPSLSTDELQYRNLVISLGKELKESQDMKALIKKIIALDLYKTEGFKK